MEIMATVTFISFFLYVLIRFARQEAVRDEYEEIIIDIEGRLDWAWSRRVFPFGMKSQLQVCREQLDRAKELWEQDKWHRAYRAALQSEEAMSRAQELYKWSIREEV